MRRNVEPLLVVGLVSLVACLSHLSDRVTTLPLQLATSRPVKHSHFALSRPFASTGLVWIWIRGNGSQTAIQVVRNETGTCQWSGLNVDAVAKDNPIDAGSVVGNHVDGFNLARLSGNLTSDQFRYLLVNVRSRLGHGQIFATPPLSELDQTVEIHINYLGTVANGYLDLARTQDLTTWIYHGSFIGDISDRLSRAHPIFTVVPPVVEF